MHPITVIEVVGLIGLFLFAQAAEAPGFWRSFQHGLLALLLAAAAALGLWLGLANHVAPIWYAIGGVALIVIISLWAERLQSLRDRRR